ncbi:hypothetical protein ABFS82_13G110400 [Erythranthe guttata]|uniref:Dof zinc finger protein n=1 Tax=Erythranthe guttata TaxID=4155 RepID=A0A022QJ28_ERYGU|nr:PREDICTED: dof zinc finger protein DOF1.6-like [Erythranthe guttata]EYU27936.1 hypothetical protein MIMGU_mgv1a027127mg [Erythranthe guttata]|eukprot:XP_012848450.1 PREDICTED: dof zinc finger protein DOF1.6-like [Erythranthe guttata]
MGLSSEHVSADHRDDIIQGFDWGGQRSSSGAPPPELSKPPPIRRPQQSSEPPLKCPRCASTNTKFCYYNNYNKSQPRHFCKSCKRHWTKGGTLRTVPLGGGRKNKRPKISNPSTTTAAVHQEDDKPNNFPSTILYQSLINNATSSPPLLHQTRDSCTNIIIGINGGADSTTISTGLNINNNPNAEFHEFTSFDMMSNASVGPTSYNDSLNVFDHNYPAGNLEYSMEESTITTVNYIPTSSGSGPSLWPGPNTTSSLEMPSYWNWNEIDDVLTSSDHLDISWPDDDYDKAEIKP